MLRITPVPVHACCSAIRCATIEREKAVKADIDPDYVETTVRCSCGAEFVTRSTKRDGQMHADVCSQWHPFYTGKQKIIDTGGRVQKFEERYGKRTAGQSTQKG